MYVVSFVFVVIASYFFSSSFVFVYTCRYLRSRIHTELPLRGLVGLVRAACQSTITDVLPIRSFFARSLFSLFVVVVCSLAFVGTRMHVK